jgi:sugar lactone lactonase YvrE
MYRLLSLGLAFGLTFAGFQLLFVSDANAAFVLRDGLILALAGALLFVWQAQPAPAGTTMPSHTGSTWLILVAITAIAAAVRLWRLMSLPPDCFDAECERALNIAAGGPTLFAWMGQTLYRFSGENLLSLRLAGALIGVATIPALYLATRRWSQPAAALLTSALLALLPWHIAASRTGDPAIILPLLVSLLWWGLLTAFSPNPTSRRSLFVAVAIALVSALLLLNEVRSFAWDSSTAVLATWRAGEWRVMAGDGGLLPYNALVAALAWAGLGVAVRNGSLARFIILLITIAVTIFLAMRLADATASFMLLLTPLFVLASLALDRLYDQLEQTWRILVRPAYLFATVLLLMLLLGGRATVRFLDGLDARTMAGLTPAQSAIGRYLARQLTENEGAPITFFAPAAVLHSQSARLRAGDALASERVAPLERTFDQLAMGMTDRELRFLTPVEERQWIDVLTRLYPTAYQENHADDESGEPLFVVFQVSPAEQNARQGLMGVAVAENGEQRILPVGPLQLDLTSQPMGSPPLTAYWQGSLLAPITGEYHFAVDGVNPASDLFTLHLDEQTGLDSGRGIYEQRRWLVRGLYRIAVVWRTTLADPPPMRVRWRRPGADWETMPPTVFMNTSLPMAGLIAASYANARWEGEPQEQWRDLGLTLPTDLPLPYSIRWQAKIAAARAGDYLFSAATDGILQLDIDGRRLLDVQPTDEPEAPAPAGLAYLEQGWHDLEIRYAPASETANLQLVWQPAGGAPVAVSGVSVAPLPPGAETGRLALPSSALLDPALGDEQFALTPASQHWQAQVRIPPTGLPLLPFVLSWQAGEGCGSDERLLDQPHGVAIDLARNRILVADTANRRVAVFALDGGLLSSLRDEHFEEPFDLTLDSDGDPLLLDAGTQQIYRLNIDAGLAEPIPTPVSFYRPRGIASSADGSVLVADTGGGRVVVLSPVEGNYHQFGERESALGRGQPVDAIGVNGAHWAVTAEDGRLWRLDYSGSVLAIQPTNTLNGPHLAALPDGSFFLTDPARSLALFHTANGQPRGQLQLAGNLVTPTGIAALAFNDLISLAIVDTTTCTLSWWQAPAAVMPR